MKGNLHSLPAPGPELATQEDGEEEGQEEHTGDSRGPHTQVWPQAVVQVLPAEQVSPTDPDPVPDPVPVPVPDPVPDPVPVPDPESVTGPPGQEEGHRPYLPCPPIWVPLV